MKISKDSESLPVYRFRLIGDLLLKTRAVVDNNNPTEFPVYNDIYTVVANSYVGTTINHTLLLKSNYQSTINEISLTVKAYIDHPIYWDEQRKYKNK